MPKTWSYKNSFYHDTMRELNFENMIIIIIITGNHFFFPEFNLQL